MKRTLKILIDAEENNCGNCKYGQDDGRGGMNSYCTFFGKYLDNDYKSNGSKRCKECLSAETKPTVAAKR